MASIDSSIGLQFLKESADFLKFQSPSTSAHLMSVHNHAVWEGFNSLTPIQQQSFCGACGSIRIAEQAHTASIEANTRDKELSGKNQKPTVKEGSIYHCPRCHRRTFPALRKQKALHKGPSSTPIRKPPLARPSPQSKNEATSTTHPREASAASDQKTTTTKNTSSKKRAKARTQQGLQALLSAGKQISQTSSSTSLDLLDFLQQ